MKYLNLTEGFNPFNAKDHELIGFESFFFSGGEPHIKLDMDTFNGKEQDVQVSIRLKSMNDLGMLAVATMALRQSGKLGKSFLFVPYFPGARQDRVMVPGEPLTVGVYANWINEFCYDNVQIYDPHSDVTPAVLDNVDVVNNLKFADECIADIISNNEQETLLISPDAGSNKKILSLAKYTGYFSKEVIKCDKTRNTSTGQISNFDVYAVDLEQKPCIIIDDICDGGGTFLGLAEELKKKNAGDLYLVVSHGIFSKGFKELRKHFKAIYTTDSWVNNYAMETPEIEKGSEIVNIIPFNEFLS
jgi:ribose-phosphate pyrophosphokinase